MAKSLHTGNIFPNPDQDAAQVQQAIADALAVYTPNPGYLEYVALVTQSGANAPSVVVLRNTLSGVPVAARASAGVSTFTLSNAFPADLTLVEYSGDLNALPIGDISTGFFPIVRCRRNTSSQIRIETAYLDVDTGDATLSDDILSNFVLRVSVYPL
jgi:hypothetical protein